MTVQGSSQREYLMDVLTTDDVPRQQRLEYWTDAICEVFVHLECDAEQLHGGDFFGHILRHRLAHLRLSQVDSAAQRVLRTKRLISRANEDFFLVSVQRQGTGVIMQDGRQAVLKPGDFALYDSTRPYELHFDDSFEQMVLMLPGDLLRSHIRNSEMLTATAVSGRQGAGHLLISMIETLKKDIDLLQPASAAAIADGAVNILVAGLRTLPAAKERSLPNMTRYHIARVKAFVDANLTNPDLGIAHIAQALQLSEAHLHRLFRCEETGLGHYIWSSRLEACRKDLGDPKLSRLAISAVAFKWGFSDAGHFSRAFRSRFGISPRQYRDATMDVSTSTRDPAGTDQ